MVRNTIRWEDFNTDIFHLWAKDWLLLCSGDYGKKEYNMMTVGWGSLGILWGKPFAMILVRPQRFTAGLLDKYPSFTLSAFPEQNRSALNFCGEKSGRDYPDKAAAAGITACASQAVAAPSFHEAELVLECVKTYESKFIPQNFIPPENADKLYPQGGMHRVWFGEVVSINGIDKYINQKNG